jgi:hypothetical protein
MQIDSLSLDLLQLLIYFVGYQSVFRLLSSCRALCNTKDLQITLEGLTVPNFELWDRLGSSRYKLRGLGLLLEGLLLEKGTIESALVRAPWVGSMTIRGPTHTLAVLSGHPTLARLGLYKCNAPLSILGSCPVLEKLRLECCNTAPPPCAKLTCLIMHECDGLIALEKFPELRKFQGYKCNSFDDPEAPASCPKLNWLGLISCDGFVKIPGCPSLTSLDLRSCAQLTDIEALASCTKLTTVCLARCKGLTDIRPLGHCGGLRQLDLGGCSGVTDISPLLECKLLTILDLARCHSLEDLSPLINCGALSYVVGRRGCK